MQILEGEPILINDVFSLLPVNERAFNVLPTPPVIESDINLYTQEEIDWRESEPVLLPYQARWVSDNSQFKLYEKSRRTGISWASALEAVLVSSANTGTDTYYCGYNYDMSYQFIRDCEYFAKALNVAVSPIEAFIFKDNEDKNILSYKIKFSSGHQIKALSSKPTNFRSKKGFVILDEFAFMADPKGMIKAVIALLMWGGRVAVISTHNGISSEFNQLIQKAISGEMEISIHRTTLTDAITEGLYKRICLVTKTEWSLELEFEWCANIVKQYGVYSDEELFCIPSTNSDRLFDHECVDSAFTGKWEDRKANHYYMMAIDPAFGGADYFCAGVFDISTLPYKLVAVYSDNLQTTKQNKKGVNELIKKYKVHFIAIEKNSGGVVVAENIAEEHPRITLETLSTSHMNKLVNTDALAVSMANSELLMPNDWKDRNQFENFSKKLRESLVGHDDSVMMCAIARCFFQQAIELMPKPSRSVGAKNILQTIGGSQ